MALRPVLTREGPPETRHACRRPDTCSHHLWLLVGMGGLDDRQVPATGVCVAKSISKAATAALSTRRCHLAACATVHVVSGPHLN